MVERMLLMVAKKKNLSESRELARGELVPWVEWREVMKVSIGGIVE